MKKQCLFTPEQKEIVIENVAEFGKFFAENGWKKAWTHSITYDFCRNFQNKPVKAVSAQLGVLFAYYIIVKNYDYFKKNLTVRSYYCQKYFTNIPTTGWSAFAYYIWQSIKELQSDEEMQAFCDELRYKIISK